MPASLRGARKREDRDVAPERLAWFSLGHFCHDKASDVRMSRTADISIRVEADYFKPPRSLACQRLELDMVR